MRSVPLPEASSNKVQNNYGLDNQEKRVSRMSVGSTSTLNRSIIINNEK